MLKVDINRSELLDILTDNKEKHRAIFLKAQDRYKARIIEEFEARLKLIRDNKQINTYFNFPVPTDQSEDYDRAIKMLEMTNEDTIQLSEEDFSKFVQDNWTWKKQWAGTNMAYGIDEEED